MDHRTESNTITQQDKDAVSSYVVDKNGVKVRMPYQMIKLVEFDDIDPKELIDIPHSARLQYRLLLMDAVIRCKVEFVKRKIIVIYNHPEAKNYKDKISQQQLIEFLAKEGVHVKLDKMTERDFDYFKEHYTYAFEPEVIRESVPYGYTKEEWQKMKVQTEAKKKEEHDKKVKELEERWGEGKSAHKDDDKPHDAPQEKPGGFVGMIKDAFGKLRSINN